MNEHLRIIDANVNRAGEALRVLEEYARFIVEDASLAAAYKRVRHTISAAVSAELAAELIGRRDIRGDVGRDNQTEGEYERADTRAVALAAGKRLTESLRAIEEYGKIVGRTFAERIEAIRYEAYDLEHRAALLLEARWKFADVRLYVLITEAMCRGDWFATACAALDGGADCLQLREKVLPDRELLARARRLADLCRQRGAMFIVNDRPDIAVLSGAHGVHLGQDDLAVSHARRIVGPHAIVGVSTHSVEQAESAIETAPDYVAVGPMFPSDTKPRPHVAGPETLAAVAAMTSLPLVAIGGVSVQNAPRVLKAARCALCVCSDVLGAADPSSAARRLRELIDPASVS